MTAEPSVSDALRLARISKWLVIGLDAGDDAESILATLKARGERPERRACCRHNSSLTR